MKRPPRELSVSLEIQPREHCVAYGSFTQKAKDENTEIHRICGEEAQKETVKIKAYIDIGLP